MALERLQKIISRSGRGSRRQAEEWIVAGRVTVNGQVVSELGSKADPDSAHIKVDGKALRLSSRKVYLALYKPRHCVTTLSDPQGRPTVMDLLKGVKERVYPVGRLDYHSEGLLLLTNDGDFANHLTAAASGIPKVYWVKVSGVPDAKDLDKLRHGIPIEGRRTLPAAIRSLQLPSSKKPASRSKAAHTRVSRTKTSRTKISQTKVSQTRASQTSKPEPPNPWYEVILREGRQNQIRRMFTRIGHPVSKLKRVKIGLLGLGTLERGRYRHLTPAEVQQLMKKKLSHR